MNPILVRAVGVVTVALACYSVAFLLEQRKKMISSRVLVFFTCGVVLDVSSTALMIIVSRQLPLTIHGVIGYSALGVMVVETAMVWRFWRRNGSCRSVPQRLNMFTLAAYGWWVTAYLAGILISIIIKA